MAYKYYGKGIGVISGFDVTVPKPLDSRTVVTKRTDLNNLKYIYEGISVYVEEESKKYTYIKNSNFISAEETPSETEYIWRPEIVAEDTDTNKDSINKIQELLDVINGDENTEGSFRKLSKNVADQHLIDINALKAKDEEHDNRLDGIDEAIEIINGDNTTTGSVEYKIAEAINNITNEFENADNEIKQLITALDEAYKAADTALDEKYTQEIANIRSEFQLADTNLDNKITEISDKVNTNTEDIETIADSLNTIIETVNNHSTSINTLNGDVGTEGSVDYKINSALNEVVTTIDSAVSHKNIVETVNITSDKQTSITINSVPEGYVISDDTIKLIINGMTYVETTAFLVNRNIGLIEWRLTEANGGFDIETDDVVQIDYHIRKNNSNESTINYVRNELNLIEHIPTTNGDYDNDPTSYSEEFDISDINVTNVYALVINGVTYSGEQINYNTETKILTLNAMRTQVSDNVFIISVAE